MFTVLGYIFRRFPAIQSIFNYIHKCFYQNHHKLRVVFPLLERMPLKTLEKYSENLLAVLQSHIIFIFPPLIDT